MKASIPPLFTGNKTSMEKIRRKVRSFDFFSGHAFYTPALKGMFVLLGLLIVGALFGAAITAVLTLIYGQGFAAEYGMLVSYPLMFVPPMMYAGYKSRSNAVFEQGYALDNNHFGKYGGWLCGLMATAAVIATAFMTDFLSAQMPPMPQWLDDALTSMTQGKLWINLLCVSVFAPLFEEWLCRGMVLRGLLNARNYDGSARFSPVWAIVISALFFAVIHANPWQAIPAFILGCLFGYIYYRTGSLKLTMLMHCVNNTVAVICGQIDSLKDMDNWMDVLPARQYWVLFAACALLVILIVRAFGRIDVQSPAGNCDPVSD